MGQRGVGAAGPCVLRRGDALAFSDVAWGTSEAVGSSILAASASPMLLPRAGSCVPLGLCRQFPGWRDQEGGGETFMETGDLCPLGGGNRGCHGDSFSK